MKSQVISPADALAIFKRAPAGTKFCVALNDSTSNFASVSRNEALRILERFNDVRMCMTDAVRIGMDIETHERYTSLPPIYWIYAAGEHA